MFHLKEKVSCGLDIDEGQQSISCLFYLGLDFFLKLFMADSWVKTIKKFFISSAIF